jgi:MoaA/NifB/PqqE/SkfB family radical SAM enzyme
MNLVITYECNRSCPYCFARGKSQPDANSGSKSPGPTHISSEDFDKYLEFLRKDRRSDLKLLGGEPTLHPAFIEMISRSLDSGFSITLFTNGLWPRSVQDFFEKDPRTERVHFIFNVNEPAMQTARESSWQAESLRIAGARGCLGFNIYREEFSLGFIPELIDTFSLQKHVRLGLASPIFGHDNSHVASSRLRRVGKSLVAELQGLERRDILCSFDCGIPLCMFDEEDIGRVFLSTTPWASLCRSGIDVGPDLSVWPCFPLSGILNVPLLDFESRDALDVYFSEKLAPFRKYGCLEECATCKYLLRKQCCGGCLARTLLSLQDGGDPGILQALKRLEGCQS